jgi:hypothetical protein
MYEKKNMGQKSCDIVDPFTHSLKNLVTLSLYTFFEYCGL